MNDITERLRSLYVQHGTDYVQEAADEIERLRAAFETESLLREHWGKQWEEQYAENKRLRAKLGAIQDREPVAAQHRFRHPQKTCPDWSPWQAAAINLHRKAWTIDSQGYEVEYRLLYTRRTITSDEIEKRMEFEAMKAKIERLRDELSDATIKLENEKLGAEMIYQENDRVMHDCQNFLNEIERLRAEIERLRAELAKQQSLTRAGLDLVEIQQRRTEKEITCLTAERDRALDRIAAMAAEAEQMRAALKMWIDRHHKDEESEEGLMISYAYALGATEKALQNKGVSQ